MRIGRRSHEKAREQPADAGADVQGIGRRQLLTGAGVATAAAALPAAAAAEQEPEKAEDADPRSLTYSETDHIRWFYARARM